MGFADGFRTGYGLVADNQDRELKKTQLENAQSNADRNFGAAEKDRAANAAYRAEDLRIKNINAGTDAAYKANQLRIQETTAGTANITAKTAQDKSDRLSDPNSLEYQQQQLEIDKLTLGIDQEQEALNQTIEDRIHVKAAGAFSKMYEVGNSGSGTATTAQLEEFGGAFMEQTKGTYFDIGHVVSAAETKGHIVTRQYLADLRDGLDPEMTNDVKRAFGTALNLGNSASVGKQITPEFTNAPKWMQEKGNKIVSQGLYNVQADTNGELSGSLYVWTEDNKGREYPYFPPLTQNRSNRSNQPLNLTIDDVVTATAARAHMVQEVVPKMKPLARQAAIQNLYGKNGDNGEAEFQNKVQKLLDTNIDGIQNGKNTQNFFAMNGDFANLPAGTALNTTQIAKMRRDIEEELLFGVKSEPDQDRVDRWLESTSNLLKSAPYTSGDSDGAQGSQTLLSLIGEQKWSPQILSNLQGYYDQDESGRLFIEDQEGLTNFLTEYGFLGGRK